MGILASPLISSASFLPRPAAVHFEYHRPTKSRSNSNHQSEQAHVFEGRIKGNGFDDRNDLFEAGDLLR